MQNKTKLINLILLLCMLLLHQTVYSQSPYVPLNHWAYDFLERMETKHAVRGVLNHTKPLSRKEFANYLKQLKENVDQGFVLNKVEQEQLSFLEFEFREELGKEKSQKLKYRSRIQKVKNQKTIKKFFPSLFYKNNRNFISWQDEQIKVFFDPVYRYKINYRRPDSTNKPEKAFHFTNGFQVWGYLTKYFGFFVDVRDNKEWGDQKYPLGNYTLPGLGFVRATSADFIYHDETKAYLKFGIKNFQLIYGKFKNYWGSTNTGSLLLSDYATSYDQLKFEYRHKKFKFTSIYAFLIDYHFQLEDKLQDKKYLAAHRLEVAPWDWLSIGLSETVIFKGRSFEPSYLNPVMFFRSAEHYLGSPDNMMMGLDFKFTAFKNIKVYGELLVDDLTTTKLGTGWYGNKYGFSSGVFWTEPLKLNNFDVRLEYARIRPYVYTHENELQYTHYNSALGHWMEPNSDLFTFSLKYQQTRRLSFSGSFQYLRHGANTDQKNYGGSFDEYIVPIDAYYPGFLDGAVEKNQAIVFYSSYEIIRNLFCRLSIQGNNYFKKNGKKIKTTSLSFSLGINY
ncbi:hypothetical protein H8E88_13270 [candidate division KSB1 bacterium]|nr:hypothetical protein [candidate division KSB1 bacterium]MBL7094763.1 hypothetical protein [candidate division KSB1 bacterium]